MNGKETEAEAVATGIKTTPDRLPTEPPAIEVEGEKLLSDTTATVVPVDKKLKKKKEKKEKAPKVPGKSPLNFLYDPKKRTVLGRDGLNWGS